MRVAAAAEAAAIGKYECFAPTAGYNRFEEPGVFVDEVRACSRKAVERT